MELLFEPKVHVFGGSRIWDGDLELWARDHGYRTGTAKTGYGGILLDPTTPLGRIYQDLGSYDTSHLDLLPEFAGRFCYRSFSKGRDNREYLRNILEQRHGSVLEHASVNVALSAVSRSFSHEAVRHRTGFSPSQESQRYVEAKDINFVVPPLLCEMVKRPGIARDRFIGQCHRQLDDYCWWMVEAEREAQNGGFGSMAHKRACEAARHALPNAAETRMVGTFNMRALRHFCELRGGVGADLEIRRVAVNLTVQMKEIAPNVFQDFEVVAGDDGWNAVRCEFSKV